MRQIGKRLGPGLVAVLRRGDAGTTEHDDGRLDPAFVHDQLRLQKLQLQPHRAQLFPRQEIVVGEGEAVGGRAGLWRVGYALGRRDILDRIAERVASGFVFHVSRLAIAWVLVQPYRVGCRMTNRKGMPHVERRA